MNCHKVLGVLFKLHHIEEQRQLLTCTLFCS